MHPILFELFGYQVRSYSVAMAMGFVVGIILIRRRAVLEQIDIDLALNVAILTIFGTILGGRALFVITTWGERFADKPWYEIFKVWQGGLVFYGGFFGSIFFVMAYLIIKKQAIAPMLDLFSPYAGLGLAIHRPFGCFMNGCCYGAPTTMPWGVHYPAEAAAAKYYGVGTALHPTQLYLGLNGLFMFLVLRWYRERKLRHGEVFGLLLAIYAVNRFIVELFRGDAIRGFVPAADLIGPVVFIIGAVMFLGFKKKGILPAQIFGGVVTLFGGLWSFFGLFSDTQTEHLLSPFSSSQYISFYTLAAGLALFAYARWFGRKVQPEYGKPLAPGALSQDKPEAAAS